MFWYAVLNWVIGFFQLLWLKWKISQEICEKYCLKVVPRCKWGFLPLSHKCSVWRWLKSSDWVLWFAPFSSLQCSLLSLSLSVLQSDHVPVIGQKLHGNSDYCQSVTFNYKLWWWRVIAVTIITGGYRLNSCLTLSGLSAALRPRSFAYLRRTMDILPFSLSRLYFIPSVIIGV